MVKKIQVCKGATEIREDGTFQFKPENKKKCKAVLDKLNPVKGNYWKRHTEEFKDEVKFSDIE